MSLLFADPLGFLPAQQISSDGASSASPATTSSGLRSLFHQWNQTVGARGTFNSPSLAADLEAQRMEQLEQLTGRMDSIHQPNTSASSSKDRSLNARRIKQPANKAQLLMEPIPVLDMDHPLNNWMTSNSDHLGPLATKNNSDWPVLPQFAVSALSNGTLVQIPILWTAMSLAMGLEIRADIIRGLPCIKRLNQLFCPTAGNRYPGDPIEKFIDENKALIRRMYGEFTTPTSNSAAGSRRSVREAESDEIPWHLRDSELFFDDLEAHGSASFLAGGQVLGNSTRSKRQSNSRNPPPMKESKDNKSDSCESTVEVVTPYWAANSAGKIRAIVNTQHFEQAVHQEVCTKPKTARCGGDCSCEQKYKWHRLLAYDPDNDCKGIFMDWFLFPSCCVCRCAPL